MDPSDPAYRDEMIPVGNVIRFLTANPTPPQPSSPANESALPGPRVALFWQLPPEVDTSYVQVAESPEFVTPVLEDSVTGTHLTVTDLTAGKTYYWRVQYDKGGWSDVWQFSITHITATESDPTGIPKTLSLDGSWPNPFSDQITIRYGLPDAQRATLTVYDVLGRSVDVVFEDTKPAGWHTTTWFDSGLASGVYFLVLETRTARRVERIVKVRR